LVATIEHAPPPARARCAPPRRRRAVWTRTPPRVREMVLARGRAVRWPP